MTKPITLKELAMTDTEYDEHARYELWCSRNKGLHGRSIHRLEAMDIFKENLYMLCIDKMNSGEQEPHFKDLLWKLKNYRKSDLDVPRAKAVPMEQILASLGFEMRSYGNIRCMLHDDKTASFSVYKKRNTFKCFGCNASGDSIDFIQKYRGCNFVEAVKLLNTY